MFIRSTRTAKASSGSRTSGVVVEGRAYGLDCLIYATGFEIGTGYTRNVGIEVYGRGGRSLTAKWADGAETLHSLFTRGFPNPLVFSTMQSGQSANLQHMPDVKSQHIAHVLSEARSRKPHRFLPCLCRKERPRAVFSAENGTAA